jgi:hypothetical protein
VGRQCHLRLEVRLDSGDWKPLGKSLGDGVIGALQSLGDKTGAILDALGGLIDKVDWSALGTKVSTAITGLFAGIDWKALGSSLGDAVVNLVGKSSDLGVKLGTAFKVLISKIDWKKIGNDSTGAIIGFVEGVDWVQVAKALGIAVFKSLKIDKTVYDAVIKGATDLAAGIGKAIIDEMSRQREEARRLDSENRRGPDLGSVAGIKAGMKAVGGFLKSIVVDPIVNSVKAWFGVRSPSTVFARIGAELINGLKGGIASVARGIGTWIYRAVIVPVVTPFARAGSWLVQHGKNAGCRVQGWRVGDRQRYRAVDV